MNPEWLTVHFRRISDAPDAIPRLRRFVLDLAVRGKLVVYDSADEPASKLLNRIRVEKNRLHENGEIPKQKPVTTIEDDEIPFALPPNWCWTRLNDITSYIQRGKSPQYASDDGLPVISQRCVQWSGLDIESAKTIARESIADYEEIRFLRDGDLLWNSTGTGTIGRIVRVVAPPEKLVCDSHVTVVRCLMVDPEYVRSWLRSDEVYRLIEDRAAGSTNQVELTSQMAINQLVPLPPLTEQNRIVAKVDELMTVCDRLEGVQKERERRRDLFVTASLRQLNNDANAGAFREHARSVLRHFPQLTSSRAQVPALRKTILNLAVRGQLAPQDANDEPASTLLERLRKEVGVYVREQRISSPRPEPIKEEEIPYPVPAGWIWTRLCSIFKVITDGDHQPPPKTQEGVAFLTIGNLTTGFLDFSNCRFVSPSYLESVAEYRKPSFGDILYTVVGATYGRPVLVDTKRPFCVQRHIAILKPPSDIDIKFLRLLLASTLVYSQATKGATGAAQPTVALKPLRNFIVPLPPLAEQRRIVSKVDELMKLCDRLEAQLTTAQNEGRSLLEAIIHEALDGTVESASRTNSRSHRPDLLTSGMPAHQ